jgi:hypothetical protein
MDIRAQQAREHHRESLGLSEQSAQHRQQRDQLVRQLRADDPGTWSYTALAKAVGCSPELIAYIIKSG